MRIQLWFIGLRMYNRVGRINFEFINRGLSHLEHTGCFAIVLLVQLDWDWSVRDVLNWMQTFLIVGQLLLFHKTFIATSMLADAVPPQGLWIP